MQNNNPQIFKVLEYLAEGHNLALKELEQASSKGVAPETRNLYPKDKDTVKMIVTEAELYLDKNNKGEVKELTSEEKRLLFIVTDIVIDFLNNQSWRMFVPDSYKNYVAASLAIDLVQSTLIRKALKKNEESYADTQDSNTRTTGNKKE